MFCAAVINATIICEQHIKQGFIANSTDYGLVAGVLTRDLNRATKDASGLRAGQVFVNEWYVGGVETPFGGYGKSGYGREKGREALWNYVQTKNIAIKR